MERANALQLISYQALAHSAYALVYKKDLKEDKIWDYLLQSLKSNLNEKPIKESEIQPLCMIIGSM